MGASPEPEKTTSPASVFVRARKDRARPEFLTEVFRPLGHLLVLVLLPLRVPPVAVVLANAAAGLAAAVAVARGELVSGALLLQLKTLLDNADGQLARASGRTSAFGRYLDTEADLVVNAAVIGALAHETGAPVLAAAAFCAVTLVLSAGFNAQVLYRRARGENVVTKPSARAEGAAARLLERVYGVVFEPQDRVLQAVSRRRLERVLTDVSDPELEHRATLAYYDGGVAALANLGLSTQFALLGLCLVVAEPAAYLWLALVFAATLPLLQLHREHLARRARAR